MAESEFCWRRELRAVPRILEMTVVYKINGEEVTREKFVKDSKGAGNVRMPYSPSRVIVSEAAAVHPKDRKEASDHARKHGFAIDFDHHGRPRFTSHRQQKAYLKTIGMYNKDSIS
jgi:hypothetical protein